MAQGRFDDTFWTGQFPTWAGAAAMLGGALAALAAFLHNLQPIGCVGMDCPTGALRSATGIVSVAGSAACLLILVGIAGMTLLARRSGQRRKLATAGLITAAAGFVLLFAGEIVQSAFFAGDFPVMPFFVIPGLLAVIAGLLMIGVLILRSGIFPRWLGILFLVSTVALLAANEQTPAVLLAIPFGLAMMTAGYFMVSGGGRRLAAPPAPSTS
ncbi:hypothetical protein PV768_01480 [Pseudarthrobacter sp. CC4]|uniref:hypothetical protein n=1 Tax=Pseudarthrobacter sp. CC4 TaxID=3029190 RepID=UPI003B8DA365